MPTLGNHLPGNRVLITGACSGLGLALAKAFAARGWRIAMVDVQTQADAIAEVEACGGAVSFYPMDVCDLSAWAQVQALISDAWGGIDVLINNAGVGDAGTIFTIDEARWQRVLDINIMGVVRGTAAFAPLMRDQHAGHIVNIASMAGLFTMPTMIAYNVSKAGVVSLSESLAAELAPHGIEVSCVCPHFFKTNIGASMADHATPETAAFLQRQMDRAPVTADQVAQTVLKAIQNKQFLVFTHPGSQRQWLMKRLMPRRALQAAKAMALKVFNAGSRS